MYAVPVRVNGEVIGAINFGYGDPPEDDSTLQKIASLYNIPVEKLRKKQQEHQTRPQFVIDYAKKRIQYSAELIAKLIEHKQAEVEIQKQLSEKETLLREVHHRIKNNIMNIEACLLLQEDSLDNQEAKIALQDAISRVQSMRILYDKLLIASDLSQISIKTYIEELVDSINSFSGKEFISMEKHISDFTINPRTAITVGIIINELLTNVYKYAFEKRATGAVAVSISNIKNAVTITIQDNGIGLNEATIKEKSSGLGLTLVKMLVQQLNGTHTTENANGTKHIIIFEKPARH